MHWFSNSPKDWEPELPQNVYVWGSGAQGQLAEISPGRLEPDLVLSFTQVREIVCGQNCTFLIQTNGTVLACGEGSYGRLGLGTSDDEPSLTPITELQGRIYIIRTICVCLFTFFIYHQFDNTLCIIMVHFSTVEILAMFSNFI